MIDFDGPLMDRVSAPQLVDRVLINCIPARRRHGGALVVKVGSGEVEVAKLDDGESLCLMVSLRRCASWSRNCIGGREGKRIGLSHSPSIAMQQLQSNSP